jgi:hypothetical protein
VREAFDPRARAFRPRLARRAAAGAPVAADRAEGVRPVAGGAD